MIVLNLNMNINERSLTTMATLNAQASGRAAANNSEDQTEPGAAMSIFSLDYKKSVNHICSKNIISFRIRLDMKI